KQESFQPIIAKLESELSESSLLYIPSFYEGNKIFLKSIGVPTPYILYDILGNLNLDNISCFRYPYVVSNEFEGDSISAIKIVEKLILEENRIIAREEIRHWLDDFVGGGNTLLDFA